MVTGPRSRSVVPTESKGLSGVEGPWGLSLNLTLSHGVRLPVLSERTNPGHKTVSNLDWVVRNSNDDPRESTVKDLCRSRDLGSVGFEGSVDMVRPYGPSRVVLLVDTWNLL